jgi:hypothetical protein
MSTPSAKVMIIHHLETLALKSESATLFNLEFTENYCVFEISGFFLTQTSSHWTDFHEISYLSIFRKFVEKVLVSLKSDKNKEYLARRPLYIFDYTSPISSQNTRQFAHGNMAHAHGMPET